MTIELIPVPGIPEIRPGDDLPSLIVAAAQGAGIAFATGDVLVVTHKAVSKAEGRVVEVLDDAAYRRLVASEAAAVIRRRGDLVITQTSHGFVCANAGVDRSNARPGPAVLLPVDPDRSAHRIRTRIARATGVDVGVIVTDTFGRAWRRGLVDVAIGISGVAAILDLRGTPDAQGRIMDVTEVAVADEISAAADLAMGKASQIPAVVVRGLAVAGDGRATDLVRPAAEDFFR